MNSPVPLMIGKLANQGGANIDTIRYLSRVRPFKTMCLALLTASRARFRPAGPRVGVRPEIIANDCRPQPKLVFDPDQVGREAGWQNSRT